MDRKQAIIVRRHGSADFEFLGGPETPGAAYEKFMPFRMAGGKHPDFAEAILCDLPIDRHERFAPAEAQPKAEPSRNPMKKLKNLVSLVAFAAIMLFTSAAQAQSYNQINSGFASTFNIAGASTNTTVASTNGSKIYVTKANAVAIQLSFKLTQAGTDTIVFKFDESVDDSTWKIASRSISVAATGTSTVGTVLNLTDANGGFLRLSQIENPATGALTNIVMKYATKTP